MKTDKGKGKRHINVRIDRAGDKGQSFVSQTSSFSLALQDASSAGMQKTSACELIRSSFFSQNLYSLCSYTRCNFDMNNHHLKTFTRVIDQ
jgi:hypothetical protein